MRVEDDLLAGLAQLLQRLEVQRDELQRLLIATEGLQVVVHSGCDEGALQDTLKSHAAAFNDAQVAEEQARLARFALCELLGAARWSSAAVQRAREHFVSWAHREEAHRLLGRITAVEDVIVGLLERLDALTPGIEAELRRRMDAVGREAQRQRQGRAAVYAYSGPAGYDARFIDRRE